ncbi:hypothetical protein AB0K74_36005 [Streptomyces sp. NPDC056159]|uniref:hypothetical protein n=1 Tax=Streptomyces sp. NPDC056159 TaxID=3155537 RepID=UPI00341CCD88
MLSGKGGVVTSAPLGSVISETYYRFLVQGERRMLAESLTVLAAAGGTAVAQAMGTDAWVGLRSRIAAWLGRGDEHRERVELERLDRSVAELAGAGQDTDEVRSRQATVWQTRIGDFLEELPDGDRKEAIFALQALLKEAERTGVVTVGTGGAVAGRDMEVRADHGSFAAGAAHVEGGVRLGNPPLPGSDQP